MKFFRFPWHPVAFALYPVLALYQVNTGLIPPGEILKPLFVMLAGGLVLWGMLGALFRNASRGALGASCVVFFVFTFGRILELSQNLSMFRTPVDARENLPWIWWPFFVAVLVLFCWKRRSYESATQAMNMAALVLLILPFLTIARAFFRVTKPVGALASGPQAKEPAPDIYYIIMDGYGRHDAVEKYIGYDNTPFIKGLRDRGFFVADAARTNYVQTELSLCSSLNMDYLQSFVPAATEKDEDRQFLDQHVSQSRVAEYLKLRGYTYTALRTGFPFLSFAGADLVLGGSMGPGLFQSALVDETPFGGSTFSGASSMFVLRRSELLGALHNLGQMARPTAAPKFVVAHILAPHPPFVFDRSGNPTAPANHSYSLVDGSHYMQHGGTLAEYKSGYAGQAEFMSGQLLLAIDQIKRNSSRPPIILVQGDHGSKSELDQDSVEKTQLGEVVPILAAFYVPPAIRSELKPDLTPVNSFRLIFHKLFGADLPPLPNRNYYSSWLEPYRFIDVSTR